MNVCMYLIVCMCVPVRAIKIKQGILADYILQPVNTGSDEKPTFQRETRIALYNTHYFVYNRNPKVFFLITQEEQNSPISFQSSVFVFG